MGPTPADPRARTMHLSEEFRLWFPLILSIITTVLALGVVYGALGGRLELIEYRLLQIEKRLPEIR